MATRRPHTYNSRPSPLVSHNTTKNAAKLEFARRLSDQLALRGWNQTDLAKAAAAIAPEGVRLGRDKVSNYIRGKNFPSPVQLSLMCEALGCRPEQLVPVRGRQDVEKREADLALKDTGQGTAWLRINEEVPWEVALQVMALLRGAKPQGEEP